MHPNRSTPLIIALAFAGITGCTQPKETTGLGAAAGGALGAGLGAIIGSQTGDAGTGLVIGAAAGATGGALVGNALQAQQEAIRSQDEAIERQERMMRAQRSEIEELRRLNQDTPAVRRPTGQTQNRPGTGMATSKNISDARARLRQGSSASVPTAQRSLPSQAPERNSGGLVERDIEPPAPKPATAALPGNVRTLGSLEHDKPANADNSLGRSTGGSPSNSECQDAAQERASATAAVDSSDKLFHLRRALRLCPDDPSFHHELGKVYLSLNRPKDAEYEFKQALTVDPNFKPARSSLDALKKAGSHTERF